MVIRAREEENVLAHARGYGPRLHSTDMAAPEGGARPCTSAGRISAG